MNIYKKITHLSAYGNLFWPKDHYFSHKLVPCKTINNYLLGGNVSFCELVTSVSCLPIKDGICYRDEVIAIPEKTNSGVSAKKSEEVFNKQPGELVSSKDGVVVRALAFHQCVHVG